MLSSQKQSIILAFPSLSPYTFTRMNDTPKKTGIIGKLLLGVVIGSAVAAVANPKSRQFLKEKGEEALDVGKQFLKEQQKEKTSLWHRLHQLVHGKKR